MISHPLLFLLFPAAAVSLLFLLESASAATPDVVTNQFHVVVKRDSSSNGASGRKLADEIAKSNGFHNLGPVSKNTHV
jgi:hypothetical protein